MRLIMNFNRHSFDAFGFDRYNRAEIDASGEDQVKLSLLEDIDFGMAFSPCNDGNKATEGEKERYKIRVPSEVAEATGLKGATRYIVEDEIGSSGFFNLKIHSYIVAGQPESFEEPIVSVCYTEVDRKQQETNLNEAIAGVINGGEAVVIMNTLRMSILGQYKKDECWIRGSDETSVCHIRPWKTGDNQESQRDLLMDLDNVILLRPNLHTKFAAGDFSIDDNGNLIFATGVDPVTDCGMSQRVIDLGGTPKVRMAYRDFNKVQKEYLKWHRGNVFRG